ncbi:hypothetical protein CDAR_180971 [Caerostris darwini]|uniref:Uncharacterized protein n=1 Tax=Caerostris darwini TaxID=1538125 RepID=A0AAV4TYF4_9ARAC|nr:hypothetical protein CDAR_180971 [Caerostris darwini]
MVFLRNRIFRLRPRNSTPRNFQLVSETENNTATSTAACIYGNRSQLLSIPPRTSGSNYPASNSTPRNFQLFPGTENNTATSTAACIYGDRSQLLSIPPHPNGSNYPVSC